MCLKIAPIVWATEWLAEASGKIVLSNRKRNFRKCSVVFFKAFSKTKRYLADPVVVDI